MFSAAVFCFLAASSLFNAPTLSATGDPSATPAERVFDRAILVHRKLPALRATLSTVSKLGKTVRYQYDVSYFRPGKALLRMRAPAQNQETASDRSFFVDGNKLIAFDHLAGEFLMRDVSGAGTLLGRIESGVGELDEPVRALLDANAMELLLLRFRVLKDWKLGESGGAAVLTRDAPGEHGRSHVVWTFDKSSSMVRSVELQQAGNAMTWTFSYATPPRSLNFSPPAEALPVSALLSRPVLPKGADRASAAVIRRGIDAFAAFRHGNWIATENGRQSEVWVSGQRIRERQKDFEWSFDGRYLTAYLRKTGRAYRQACGFVAIPALLGNVGIPLDASAWHYLSRKSPLFTLMTATATIKTAGQIELDGVSCDVLQIADDDARASLSLRRTDGLIAGSGFSREGADREKIGNTVRSIRYKSIGKPLPASTFRVAIPSGKKPSAFPVKERASAG